MSKLFKPGRPETLNACVGNNGGKWDFGNFSDGYFQSAHIVSRAILLSGMPEGDRRKQIQKENDRDAFFYIDVLIYPIAMGYRHSVELFLKHMIVRCGQINKVSNGFNLNHGLKANWILLKSILISELKNDVSRIEMLDNVVDELDSYDTNGIVFRYPEFKDGTMTIPKEQHCINILVLFNEMEKLYNEVMEPWMCAIEDVMESIAEAEIR